ncbi:MAG: hypothetical protein AAB904_02380 [Patescibacteria group bacterium]
METIFAKRFKSESAAIQALAEIVPEAIALQNGLAAFEEEIYNGPERGFKITSQAGYRSCLHGPHLVFEIRRTGHFVFSTIGAGEALAQIAKRKGWKETTPYKNE